MLPNLQSAPPSPDQFFATLFDCDAARSGGVVTLSQLDMERAVGRDRFVAEIKQRRFTALENRGQILIVCNAQDLRLIV